MTKDIITSYFMSLQDDICRGLEVADGQGLFQEDVWERPGGGGGRTRVIQGNHIEKGGVNFSAVEGVLSSQAAKALKIGAGGPFFATGVSIVLHPKNPHVPIIHMNVRYFEMNNQTWWFGGGIDLTPHYIIPSDAGHFHRKLKSTCDKTDVAFYPKFKKWADDYFFIKHRDETRGVGGIFYDRLGPDSHLPKEDLWQFTQSVGETFLPAYLPIFNSRKLLPYTEQESAWQRLRRGRYVEFNLVWDRGTKFGLETNGRTESILMSLPPLAAWEYDFTPTVGSEEELTLQQLKKGIDWSHH